MRSLPIVALLALSLSSTAVLGATCDWPDGQDPAGPANDRGRGVADWQQHYDYVAKATGSAPAAGLVSDRMLALRGCADKAAYARLYADLSMLIGYYGRTSAGWIDAVDKAAPADDPGRGIRSWSAHNDHVMKGAGFENAHKLVGDRLRTLSIALPKPDYARLYADISILVANYARAR